MNIAGHLPQMAASRPEMLAVASSDGRGGFRRWSFERLENESNAIAHGLEARGIRRGVRTVLMVPPGPEMFALTFALFKVGAILVLVDPGMGVKKLGICLAEAKPEAFIGITKAHAARALLGWGRATIRKLVTVGPRLFWGGVTLKGLVRGMADKGARAPEVFEPDETCAVLFTSGSTGVPKGAVYTHGIFEAQVALLRETYGIEPGEVDLATFPLFALFDAALGMSAVVPEMNPTQPAKADPQKILHAIDTFGVTNMFASPALVHRIARHGKKLKTIRRAISAGAPASPPILQLFQLLLPDGAEIHTPYGATESLPVSTIGSAEILGETAAATAQGKGVCVGKPVRGMSVSIIPISDEPIASWETIGSLPTGEIGEITVAGPVVTRTYDNSPESTALAKIVDKDGVVHHRMGDVGYLDDCGRIWFCGRKAHRVETPEGTLFTAACEGLFNSAHEVYRTALVGVSKGGKTIPVLCVQREPAPEGFSTYWSEDSDGIPSGDRDDWIRGGLLYLGQTQPHTARIQTILFHKSFPVDTRHNAKIFREKLAVWAAKQLR
ncbi:MAG: fatty acid CoA ligase family protein [Planctomycetota bacterium]